jgi:hypothetical protein
VTWWCNRQQTGLAKASSCFPILYIGLFIKYTLFICCCFVLSKA